MREVGKVMKRYELPVITKSLCYVPMFVTMYVTKSLCMLLWDVTYSTAAVVNKIVLYL